MIDDYQEDNYDWKSLFIKNIGIIENCSNYQIAFWGNKIALAKSTADGWRKHAELYSYVFYKTKLENNGSNLNPFQRTWYLDTADGTPCAVIDLWNYQNKYSFAIDLSYSDNGFSLSFYDKNKGGIPNEIILLLKKLYFKEDDSGIVLQLGKIPLSELDKKIHAILKKNFSEFSSLYHYMTDQLW